MADVSLDEVIRRFAVYKMFVSFRPMFGRVGGGESKNFDARQKIGVSDARQRLGGGTVKDAREKLVQKDARFKIRGRGGSGAVQDARQMINSRKQGLFTTNVQGLNTRVIMDARDRLSLKRSIGGTQAQAAAEPALKITKTIQVRVQKCTLFSFMNCKSIRISLFTMTDSLFSNVHGPASSLFSMTAPITKVVKNDAYTAPRPPVPVVPTRPNTSTAAASSSAAALRPPTFSPLEGTKITVNNLHPRVSEEDIVELFCVCGALKRARLVKVGVAEVVFVRKEDAVSAYRKYNNRCLDGQPMKCNLHIQGSVITSDQPILLRLSDTPGAGGSVKKDGLPPSLSRPSGQRASSQPTAEVDPQTILKALFKSTTQSTSTTEAPSSQTTAFRIKI
uniref:DNA polymerase delta interacting protein 3 n=1 Tax=Fundulus heteroclitus TaxID=8078 RepID=A0A3Q2NZK9_FUNHE